MDVHTRPARWGEVQRLLPRPACPTPPVEAKEGGEAIHSVPVSCRDSMTSSSLPDGVSHFFSLAITRQESLATTFTAASRTTSPLPQKPYAMPRLDRPCRSLLQPLWSDVQCDTATDFDEDIVCRSGSCSRCPSCTSSFSLGAGCVTPLTWKMSSLVNGISASGRTADSPCLASMQEDSLGAALMERRAKEVAEAMASWGTPAPGVLPVLSASDYEDDVDGGGDVQDASLPLQERSMALVEVFAERARRQLPLE
ncbi:hypothetical protein TraAM80_01677 [Trypanosoma rangeli]|uniref:Uncharacterized protein n=1 Tax=Trypanosoma rangeli TaxID=5698 RepID=A0A3R7MZ04_TRYRA|nr:uncharacterized protein TraAM80_01677 [Trypanosoma rangeli]RNF10238.1 hypothetical protein TraAM80_01677 [Trypanosoma rangeli]|eukprot:RNF10238.1 hypothetical protein TraAM80_01677 [Trypanosoma rangeli]